MMEIWQYAIPASWNKKLQEQGKDPVLDNRRFIERLNISKAKATTKGLPENRQVFQEEETSEEGV
jgi:hypothetical protein